MNRERLFKHLEDHYIPKREMISRIPLDVQPEDFWQDVLKRRRAKSISLPLHNPRGIPYWYTVTSKMVSASEKIINEMLENETDFDPYRDTPSTSSLEESFFTSYVEGSQITLQDAMNFLQGEREPQEPEEQMIINNRNALSFAGANLFRPVDEDYIRTLAYILTENIDGGGQEYRMEDFVEIPSMAGIPYEVPPASTLQDKVDELCHLLRDPSIHPLIKSGIAQAWVMVTRPFPEGNERLGRLLSQVILFRAGYVFFSDISLSSLIARTSYAYFTAIENILQPENGADLTYFLDYYMTLLAKGIEERHLRMNQRAMQEMESEQQLARQPLSPLPEQTEMDIAALEKEPTEPDNPGESEKTEGGDGKTNGHVAARAKIMALFEGRSEKLKKVAEILLQYLGQGKTTLTVIDLCESLKIDTESAGSIVMQLKNKEILKSLQQGEKYMVYTFCGENLPDKAPKGKEAFCAELEKLAAHPHSMINKAIGVLLQFLNAGKYTFYSPELQEKLKMDNEQTYRICYQLKEHGVIILTGYMKEKPVYALAFEENEAAHCIPVKPRYKKQSPPIAYTPAFLERLNELKESTRSSKDMRIAAMLTDCLPQGMVTFVDYKNAGLENYWKKDMLLAMQLGLVTRFNQGCFRIARDVKPGPAVMSDNQKEIASAMYQSFGDDVFSSEMVVATLDYTHSHVSAVLHQFTLMKILKSESDSDNRYSYQFIVNPRENPECFSEAA